MEHSGDAAHGGTASHDTFSSKGSIPPVAAGTDGGAHKPTASELAFGAHDAKDEKKKKAKPTGFSKSGGGTVRDALTRLANAGKLKISAHQIAQLDALAQVETGGQVASVDTTDDMVVSIGFHQVVLGHKSVEWVIQRAPAAFAKHGIELDPAKTYNVKGWSHPHQIKGVEDPDDLRGHEWGDRFYAASLEDDVIAAVAEWALKEAKEVEAKTTHAGGKGNSFWDDDTTRTWLLEVDNNREAYTSAVVKRAVAAGANAATDREKFLDILSNAIMDTYEELEPKLVGYPALKRKYPHEDDAKLHEMAKKYGPIGRTKGMHIVTRISRHLKVPTLNEPVAAAAAPAAPAAKPAAAPAPAVEHHDEHHDAPPPPPTAVAQHVAAADQTPAAPSHHDTPAHAAPETNATSPHSFTGPAHLRVTATGLNVRSSPTTHDHGNIIGGMHHGQELEALEREGEWIVITYKGQRAYVHGGFVEAVPAQVKNAEQVAKNPDHAAAQHHDAPSPPTVATAEHHEAKPEAAHHDAKSEAAHHEPAVAARTASPATRAHHDAPAASHHEAAAASHHEHAPETHHEPAVPAQHAEAAKPALEAQAVRGHYQTLLVLVETGFMTPDVAIEQLIAFDRGLHGGQMSPTGVELIAEFPLAIARHQSAKAGDQAASAAPAAKTEPSHPAPTAAAPAAPAHAEAPAPAVKQAPADTTWAPPAGSKLTDPQLLKLAAKVNAPQTLLDDIGGILEEAKLAKKQTGGGNEMEYTNADHRDSLVRGISAVRGQLEQLDHNDPNVVSFKVAVYHEIERIAPYHFQKNIRAIESWDKPKAQGGRRQWSTCNLTSLAMCLETVGKNARNFPAQHDALLGEVAKVFEGDINAGKDDQGDPYAGAVLTGKGKGTSVDTVKAFRLPDFLELAAVVYSVIKGGYTHDEAGILKGANDAVLNKSDVDYLQGLTTFMTGTPSKIVPKFDADPKKNLATVRELRKYGLAHRGDHSHEGVEKMNTQRNLMEKAGDKAEHATNDKQKAKYQADHDKAEHEYQRLDKTQHQWLDNADIEKTLSIEAYRTAVTNELGPQLDAGKGVIAGLAGHYVRLFQITPTGVMVQDPGQWNRSENHITWEEARAMGYFWVNLIIS